MIDRPTFWLFSIVLSKTSTWRLAMIMRPGARRNAGHGVALGGEVRMVVLDDLCCCRRGNGWPIFFGRSGSENTRMPPVLFVATFS